MVSGGGCVVQNTIEEAPRLRTLPVFVVVFVQTSYSARPLFRGVGKVSNEESFEDQMSLSFDLQQRDGRDGGDGGTAVHRP